MRKLTSTEVRLSIIIIPLIIMGIFTYNSSDKELVELRISYNKSKLNQEALATLATTQDSAKAVYVYDVTDKKVLFERNAENLLPLASITKLATALTVNKLMNQDKFITIDPKALESIGDNGLISGEEWRLSSLVGFMLIASANDAARQIELTFNESEGDFVQSMNDYAKEIGLINMKFSDPAGLDIGSNIGGLGSAKEVAYLIMDFLVKMPEVAKLTTLPQANFTLENGERHTVSNTNDLSVQIDSLLASKTGYTSLAGGNLAIIYRVPVYDHEVAIVVLGSTKGDRFVDIASYMQGVENYFKISQN